MRTELALREFLASRISADLSPATIEWYKGRLIPFAESCLNLPRRPEPIEQFMATIQGSPETKWDCYRALKTFFRFMSSRHRIPNPMDAIRRRRPKTFMPTLEPNELMRILSSVQEPRDRVILTLIIDNGVRAGEVCSLLKHNIKEETVVVYGKTDWREVPISDETRRLLLQFAAASPDEHVFHGHKGPITRHLIYAIVRRHMEKAGIKGPKMGPHRIRHAFAKRFLVNGGDLRSLQLIMGHADIKTTQKYASLNRADIIKKHREFSPLPAAQGSFFDVDQTIKEAEEILEEGGLHDNAGAGKESR